MNRTRLLGACAAALLAPLPALACLHGPEDYEGRLGQEGQEAIIFWSEGRQEMIMRLNYVLETKGDPPPSLAWIVPVPAVPDAYGEEDPNLFQLMAEHWEAEHGRDASGKELPRRPARGSFSFSEDGGVEVLEGTSVGGYDIQPLRAVGPKGAQALNGWLKKHGYAQVPVANMAHYVERKWVWLAVRVNAKGAAALGEEGTLRPLRISFASERIVYPLKFSTHQGEFYVRLWIVTDQPLPDLNPPEEEAEEPEEAKEGKLVFEEDEEGEEGDGEAEEDLYAELLEGFTGDSESQRYMPLPERLDAMQLAAKTFKALDNRVGIKVPHVTQLAFDVDGENIARWKQDLSFEGPKPAPKKVPGRDAKRGPDASVMARVDRSRLQRHIDSDQHAEALAAGDRLLALPQHTAADLVWHARALNGLGERRRALKSLAVAEAKGGLRPMSFGGEATTADLWSERAEAHAGLDDLRQALACADKAAAQPRAELYQRVPAVAYAAAAGLFQEALTRMAGIEEGLEKGHVGRRALLELRGLIKALTPEGRPAGLADLEESVRLSKGWRNTAVAWHAVLGGDQAKMPTYENPSDPIRAILVPFARGSLTLAQLRERATDLEDPHERRVLLARAEAMQGVRAELAGKTEEARGHYQACAKTHLFGSNAWMWSRARLVRDNRPEERAPVR